MVWDETVVYQSKRSDAYEHALNQLESQGLLYRCDCSRRDLENRPGTLSGARYDGHCRNQAISGDFALRIQVPDQVFVCPDQIQGAFIQNLEEQIGDFILYRRDKVFAYHLAVVVDDVYQEITEVFRGFDLLESTPRQIFLQNRLDMVTPSYAHIPVIADHNGQKLSKQAFAEDVSTMPVNQTLFKILTWLGQNPPGALKHATQQTLLDWGIENWRLVSIPRLQTMEVSA